MKFSPLFFILLLFNNNLYSQTLITGNIKDTTNFDIPLANIVLYEKEGDIIKYYTYSKENGIFRIQAVKDGEYRLEISALGFLKYITFLSIGEEDKEIEIISFLKVSSFELREVYINYENPIIVKTDTIIFDAKSFAQGNEQVVEDLLKKIPGLSIDSEGVIKVGNKEVEKVMVDGDDFFERGYKILTKNMPAHPIKKVEVYQNYSNNKLLKGVEESDKVALNLTLEEDAKRIWFGDLELGYGLISENRYEVLGNIMNFGKKNKYYFLTNLNNTGYDATGDISQLVRPFRNNEPASIGDDQRMSSIINLAVSTPNFKRNRTNFNNTELVSVNAIFNLNEKLKLKTLGFFHWDERDFFRKTEESFTANQTNFTNFEENIVRFKEHVGFGKIDMLYDISKTSTLETITKYNKGATTGSSNLVFNGTSTLQGLEENNILFDQKISYTNRFNDKKVFLLTGRFIEEHSPQNYHTNRFFYENLFPTIPNVNNVAQLINKDMQYSGIEAHLLDRRENGNLLEMQLGALYRKDNLNSRFQLKVDENLVELPADFQNSTAYSSNNLYFKTKYLREFNDFSFIGKLDFHQLFNKLVYENISESENLFFINPSIGLDWKINSKNRIKTSYSLNTINSEIQDVYNNYILTGFRNFQASTGSFNHLEASSFLINYELGEWSDRFFANALILYTKNHDFFSTQSIINANYTLNERILFKDREFLSLNTNVDRYFQFIRSNLKMDLGYLQSNYKNIVNDSGVREIQSWNFFYGIELRSGFSGLFNYHFGTKWTSNKIQTGTFSNSFTNNMSFSDLLFLFSDRFETQIKTERYYFGNIQEDNVYYFLDVDATYHILPKKITLSFEARNLFDTQNFTNFTISDIGTSTTSYRLLPRFVLMKLKYRF